jgi:CheY-like chemotaxis protein
MSVVNILVVDDKEENIVALEALLKRDDINILHHLTKLYALPGKTPLA